MNTRPFHIAPWCLALLVVALESTTLAEPPGGGGPGGPGGRRFGPGSDRRGWNDLGQEERQRFFEELRAFCVEHSPRRWQEIESRIQLGQRGPGGGMSKIGEMAKRFGELQMLEKTDPELHKIKVSLLEVEDVEYGLLSDLKDTAANNAGKIADLKAQLQEQSKQYVNLRLRERGHRINWLNKQLEHEKKRLADDQAALSRLVDMRVAELEKQGPEYFFRDRMGMGRPRGAGPTTAPTTAPTRQAPPGK